MNVEIGHWAARFRGEIRLTKDHLVESVIANREVTHCGRQLGNREGTEVREVQGGVPDTACMRCWPY